MTQDLHTPIPKRVPLRTGPINRALARLDAGIVEKEADLIDLLLPDALTTLVSATALGAAVASFTVMDSIPDTYNVLELILKLRGTTDPLARVRFNDDAGANYGDSGQTGILLTMPVTTSPSGSFGLATMRIAQYSQTDSYKIVAGLNQSFSDGTPSGDVLEWIDQRWANNASKISKITVVANGGVFDADSIYMLVGWQ